MKRLTIIVAAMLVILLVVRPRLYAQDLPVPVNPNDIPAPVEPNMGGAGSDSGQDTQDSGDQNSDQQVAPDQPIGAGDEASDADSTAAGDPTSTAADDRDSTAAGDPDSTAEPGDENDQNAQSEPNDNQCPSCGR